VTVSIPRAAWRFSALFGQKISGQIILLQCCYTVNGAFLPKCVPLPRVSARAKGRTVLFVVHAIDKKNILPTRAKHYRAHCIHLDQAEGHAVDVVTADTLVADDGETPLGSIIIVDAADRATVDTFTRSDPYYVNGVWERVAIHRLRASAKNNPVARRVEALAFQPGSLALARSRNKH
jgi:uncharacterized protein YciI